MLLFIQFPWKYTKVDYCIVKIRSNFNESLNANWKKIILHAFSYKTCPMHCRCHTFFFSNMFVHLLLLDLCCIHSNTLCIPFRSSIVFNLAYLKISVPLSAVQGSLL